MGNKRELIEKLENTSRLYQDTVEIQNEMDTYTPEDRHKRSVVVPKFPGKYRSDGERKKWEGLTEHDSEDAPEVMAMAFDRVYGPKKPEKPVFKDRAKAVSTEADKTKQKLGCLPIVCLFIGVIALITALMIGDSDALTTNLNWGIFAVCVVVAGFFFLKLFKAKANDAVELREKQKQYDREVQEKTEAYNSAMQKYERECTAHEQARQEFLDAYSAWRDIYLDHMQEEAEIKEKLEAERAVAVQRIYEERYVPAVEKLKTNNDMVGQEYLPVLGVIIDLIRSGRADDFKEAVNLYEDIVYRERQLEQQRQIEEQRQYEEELRRRDEERRYQEEKQFREDQERQRRREEEQRQRDDERRHREDMAQREKQARDEQRRLAEERRGQKRCVWCAHKLTCRQQYYEGAYNCTGFTPKN